MNRTHVSFEEADKAVIFIKESAKRYGTLSGACKGLEHTRGVVRSEQKLLSKKSTVSDREAEAEASPEYKLIIEAIENTWAEKVTLETHMKYAEMTYDLYRSSNKWGGP